MKRLCRGEYKNMTPEQQFEHRKKRRAEWEKRPGKKQMLREINRQYQKRHWLEVANTYFWRECKRCGEMSAMKGRRTICDLCKQKPTKTSMLIERMAEKAKQKKARTDLIILLATTTNMTQKEIAKQVGTYQPVVSYTLRANNLRRQPYRHRAKND